MFRVKITTNFPEQPIIRQSPGGQGVWGEYRFFINQEIDECDFWVVYEGLTKSESTKCPQGNIIFITGEPPSIKEYQSGFLHQFNTVVTSHPDIKHPDVIYSQQALPWHIGMFQEDRLLGYDSLKALDYNTFNKTDLISVIVSNKNWTEGHVLRLEFVQKLKEHFGSRLEVFGRGIRDINDKWEAIAGYKYHIVLENSSFKDYWTEKLADSFLAYSYPFYFGCSNIKEYFPETCYTSIDINDIDRSIQIIEQAITENMFEKSIDHLNLARNLVLDRYNLFPMLTGLLSGRSVGKKTRIKLRPESEYRANMDNAGGGLLNRLKAKLKNTLSGL